MISNLPCMAAQQEFQGRHSDMLVAAKGSPQQGGLAGLLKLPLQNSNDDELPSENPYSEISLREITEYRPASNTDMSVLVEAGNQSGFILIVHPMNWKLPVGTIFNIENVVTKRGDRRDFVVAKEVKIGDTAICLYPPIDLKSVERLPARGAHIYIRKPVVPSYGLDGEALFLSGD